MAEKNAVHGTEISSTVELTASSSDTEIVAEPKYVGMDTMTTNIVLPDESQFIVVTRIFWSAIAGACSFFFHGGENPTPIKIGPKFTLASGDEDVQDVYWVFPMSAPVKISAIVAAGATLMVGCEYEIHQTQNRIATRAAYAE